MAIASEPFLTPHTIPRLSHEPPLDAARMALRPAVESRAVSLAPLVAPQGVAHQDTAVAEQIIAILPARTAALIMDVRSYHSNLPLYPSSMS